MASETTVDLGHERSALLMARQNEPDPVRLLQRDHEIGVFLARHAENVLHAFRFQALNEQI